MMTEEAKEPETKPERVKRKYVFKYHGTGSNKKPVTVWVHLEDAHKDGSVIFGGKMNGTMGYASPGQIFQVEATPDGSSIYPATAHFIGRLEEENYQDGCRDLVARWEALDIAYRQEQKAKRAQKAAARGNLQSAVDRIRESMRGLNAIERAQVLAWVVQEISKR